LRKNQVGRRRQRFSFGHELGHVVIPWHLGTVECVLDRPSLEASGAADQESEAHRFASGLLVPRSFFEEHGAYEFAAGVEALDLTDISAFAAVLSLSRNLMPGFCFLIDEDQDELTLVKSSGTAMPARRDGESWERGLSSVAHDKGEAVVSGRRILWFRLVAPVNFALTHDSRSTTQLLRDAITQVGRKRDSLSLAMRVNGIVGGLLSREERAQSVEKALSVLEYRFAASHPDLQDLMEVPDFRTYLRRKALERVTRQSSLPTAEVLSAIFEVSEVCLQKAARAADSTFRRRYGPPRGRIPARPLAGGCPWSGG
jgi:hypothetical protein